MTAIQELRSDIIGPEFLGLLRRTFFAVATTHNFPPPEGDGPEWRADHLTAIVNEFFADRQTDRRLADLVLHCGDDRALAARLQGVVRHFLADQGRRTEVGRLVRRVKRTLRADPEFIETSQGRWTLRTGATEPSTVRAEALIAATAREREVVVPAWDPMSDRKPPFADAASIKRLITRVLETASGSVRAADIAKAMAARLHVVSNPMILEADAGDRPEPVQPSAASGTSEDVLLRMRAEEVLALLTDRERLCLAHPDLGVRELGPVIGLSHSQAAAVRQRAIETLKAELDDEEGGQDVGEAVLDLARMWARDRTAGKVGT